MTRCFGESKKNMDVGNVEEEPEPGVEPLHAQGRAVEGWKLDRGVDRLQHRVLKLEQHERGP